MSSPSQPLHRTCAASPSWYLGRPRLRLRALPSLASNTSYPVRKSAAHWQNRSRSLKIIDPAQLAFRSPTFATKSARSCRERVQQRRPDLLDHLIGAGEQRVGHGEAERLGGLEIDHQLILGRVLHRARIAKAKRTTTATPRRLRKRCNARP